MYGQRVTVALVIILTCWTQAVFSVLSQDEANIARAHRQSVIKAAEKERDIRSLIARTEKFLKTHSVSETCDKIVNDSIWRKGELFIFLFRPLKGTCYAFGDQRDFIWSSFFGRHDVMQLPLIDRLLNTKEDTSVAFDINNATMHAYVKKVIKDGETFLIGSGFYPSEPYFILVDLVNKTKDWMNLAGVERTFSIVNNPFGRLRIGNTYIFVTDADGYILAIGKSHARRGQRVYEGDQAIFSERNKKQQDDVLAFAKSAEQSKWFTHHFSNSTTYVYIEKFLDKKTNKLYLIAAVGRPEVDEKDSYQLVQEAIAFLKKGPRDEALEEFTVNKTQRFIRGVDAVEVYALDGTCLANGERPDLVGYNCAQMKDVIVDGDYPIKQLIDEVKRNGSAWQTTYEKNAYKATYAELVDLPDEQLVVAAGFWLSSRRAETQAMVERAVKAFERYGISGALERLVNADVDFLRGDLYPRVATSEGVLLTTGYFSKFDIWGKGSRLFGKEKAVIQKVLKKAREGDGWVEVKRLNTIQNTYVKNYEHILPGGKKERFVVWAGYWV